MSVSFNRASLLIWSVVKFTLYGVNFVSNATKSASIASRSSFTMVLSMKF